MDPVRKDSEEQSEIIFEHIQQLKKSKINKINATPLLFFIQKINICAWTFLSGDSRWAGEESSSLVHQPGIPGQQLSSLP